jgi:hypothetical protein
MIIIEIAHLKAVNFSDNFVVVTNIEAHGASPFT